MAEDGCAPLHKLQPQLTDLPHFFAPAKWAIKKQSLLVIWCSRNDISLLFKKIDWLIPISHLLFHRASWSKRAFEVSSWTRVVSSHLLSILPPLISILNYLQLIPKNTHTTHTPSVIKFPHKISWKRKPIKSFARLTRLVSEASVLTQTREILALMCSSLGFLDESSSLELLSEVPRFNTWSMLLFPLLWTLLLLLSAFLFLDAVLVSTPVFLLVYSSSWFLNSV